MTEETSSKKKAPVKKAAKKAPLKKVAKSVDEAEKALPEQGNNKTLTPSKSHSTHSFKNDFVQVEVEYLADCKANLDVKVSQKILQEANTKALKEVSKNISIPGFRKGKVPKEMIQSNYANYVTEQYQNLFLQQALEQALLLTHLRPLNYRNIKPKILSETEHSAHVTFSFETYPVVPEIDLESIKLKKVEPEDIDQARIDEVIDVMRTYRAKWNPVVDRGVEMEDFVEVDIENLEEGTKIVSQKRVQVSKGKLSSWIMKLLLGTKKGESKEGMSKWDDEVMPKAEKKDFKAMKCKVSVLDIFTADLPPVDESFAQAMGTQSVADLRTQVMLRLKKNAEEIVEAKQREELDDQLEKLVDFQIPQSLIDAEIKTKIQLKEQELKYAHFSDADIQKRAAQTEEEAKKEALRSLKLFFILQKLANDNKIIVSEQELRQVVAERISQLNLPQEFKSSPQFNSHFIQEVRMNCFVELLTDKVKRYLLKKVVYS